MKAVDLTSLTILMPGILVVIAGCFLVKIGLRVAVRAGVASQGITTPKWLDWVCIALLVLVLVMLSVPPGCKTATAYRNRTSAFHRGIMSGLENYHAEMNEYPAKSQQSVHAMIDGHDYDVSGALMLYQAMTGDGNDKIVSAIAGASPSDGKVEVAELSRAFMKEMPKELVLKTEAGYILTDGFGHPFQYTLGGPDSVNTTYDLWSFAETDPVTKVDKEVKQSPIVIAKWIKNW